MNAISSSSTDTPAAPVATRPQHPLRSFGALLKRELRQHRGALVYTPLVVGAFLVVIWLLGIISGESFQVRMGGNDKVSLQVLLAMGGSEAVLPQRKIFFEAAFFAVFSLFHGVLFVVLMIYCLSALFDERKDRSVLFWKSMPVSDTRTVLSKLVTALVVAPLIVLVVVLLAYLGLLLAFSVLVWRHSIGVSAFDMVWRAASPFGFIGSAALLELVNGLWLLPIYGWMLLCSSFARVRPILWAALVPFCIWVLGQWIQRSGFLSLKMNELSNWLVGRFLAGVVPLGPNRSFEDMGSSSENTVQILSSANLMRALGSADLWIGVAIGAAFVAAAIYWRRYRDDSI